MVMPSTLEELAEAVRTGGPWRIEGLGTKGAFGVRASAFEASGNPSPTSAGERGRGEVSPEAFGVRASAFEGESGNPSPGATRPGGGQGGGPGEGLGVRSSAFEASGNPSPTSAGERGRGEGSDAGFGVRASAWGSPLSTLALTGIEEWSPADQVVVVRAGTPLSRLQAELRTQAQCLPLPHPDDVGVLPAGVPGTVGGLVAMNLPHALQAQCGGVRDWVLGLTLVRPDGTIAKCGSRVVKNVAGYDVQKLMIGARGTLGVIGLVVLRTYPLRALPKPELTGGGDIALERAWIQRTLHADFIGARAAAHLRPHRADDASSTLWADVGPDEPPPRFHEDWVLAPGVLPLPGGPVLEAMRRTKHLFDPDARLNPGAMGAW